MLKQKIESGNTYLGIELGSTRIKACLIDDTFTPIASGSYDWENRHENGYWTYDLTAIHAGVQGCFQSLAEQVKEKYDTVLKTIGGIGVSAMMHGYLAFDAEDRLLVPFRTWRNTTTGAAAAELTELFRFNIPQRWSIAHLYQAILNQEPHIAQVAHINTLAGYIHFLLTGKREVGIGDASGIFPICGTDYDSAMLDRFQTLIYGKGIAWNIRDLLPQVKCAGSSGTVLSEAGAAFLDPTGTLQAGIPVCPPEGDAGTGMVATNAVSPRTGNVSAGTSIFAMLVLEHPLRNVYPEIDMVTTPDGMPVAMVHCNNCSSEWDTWVRIFGEFAALTGVAISKPELYDLLYHHAVSGTAGCEGVVAYNYLSGEHVTHISEGRPMYFRLPDQKMTLAGFMKAQLFSTMSTLKMGMDLLFENEHVVADRFLAHGGLFKTEGVAQQVLANALNTAISVMQTAGEGGAWGMALLAAYMAEKTTDPLGDWLEHKVFAGMSTTTLTPAADGVKEFTDYITRYAAGLPAERSLGEVQ